MIDSGESKVVCSCLKEPQENEIKKIVDEKHYDLLIKNRFNANKFLRCLTRDCEGTYTRHDDNNFFYCEICD